MQSNYCLAYALMSSYHRLDLAWLNAIPAKFHLMVQPAQKLDISTRQVAAQIACSIQSRAGCCGKWIRYKLFRRDLRTIQISACECGASQIKLTGNRHRDRIHASVE